MRNMTIVKKTPHPIVNKLKYALRHSKMWKQKVVKDKKKESKKRGYYVIGEKYDD